MIDPIPELQEECAFPINRFVIMQGHKFQNYPGEINKLPKAIQNYSNYGFGMTASNKMGMGLTKAKTLNLSTQGQYNMAYNAY